METLIGKIVLNIEPTTRGDEGVKITFSDGQTLEVVYSGCQGYTILNGEKQ